jgi:hypothetical protein
LTYTIKILAVVVTDVEVEGEYEFERRQFGTTPDHLRLLSEWFVEAEVPGFGVNSAQQILAEVGATAATFASEKHLSSWVGVCSGDEESAGVFGCLHSRILRVTLWSI